MDHRIRPRKVQSRAAGPQADEEHRNVPCLKVVDDRRAIERFARQRNEPNRSLCERGCDEIEHARELRKEQDAAAFLDHRHDHIEKHLELRAFDRFAWLHMARWSSNGVG